MSTPKKVPRRLGLVLLVYILLSLAYNIQLPLGHAPDEMDHFRYINFIARYGRLPLTMAERDLAGNKAYLPALYHCLTAALIGWSDSQNPPHLKFLWESPRADIAQAWFNTAYQVNTEDELWPFQGIILMWHLGRLVSMLWGLGVIIVTYLSALELFPQNYRLAVTCAAIIAFIPTFIFISAAVSYESLSAFLIGLYFLMLIKILKGHPGLINYIWLGVFMGLAVTVKYVAVILPLETVWVVSFLVWRWGWGWRGWIKRLAVIAAATIVASSWWFLFLALNFNQVKEYGWVVGLLKPIIAGGTDTTQNYTAFMLTGGQIGSTGELNRPPFSSWVWLLYQSFWVEKIVAYPLGLAAQLFIGLMCGLAGVGLTHAWRRYRARSAWFATLFMLHGLAFIIFPFLRYLIQGELSHTAQGRHLLFPIATMVPLVIVFGWAHWLPLKTQQKLALVTLGGLVGWSIAQLVHVTVCCGTLLPVRTTPDTLTRISHPLQQTFGDHLILRGYEAIVTPETGVLDLNLYWQSTRYADEDYMIAVNLIQNGQIKLKWLAYPAGGRYPTRIWESWETVKDKLIFPLSELSPGDYQIQLQVLNSQQALPVNGSEWFTLGQINVPGVPLVEPDIALPVWVNDRPVVGGLKLWQVEDYRKLNQLEFQPRMVIPFVWQGQPEAGEQVKWLLVDPNGKSYPARSSTAYFEYFMAGPDWLPGDYRLRAEVWRDGVVLASRETPPVLTIFNKLPRLVEPPAISSPLVANFANRIKLLGYHLPRRSFTPGQRIPITLYWQALRTMEHNYTFFTKLLDQQHQQWGGVERFARDGYKTSHWLENEVVVDQFELPTDPHTPPGIYQFDVGLYLSVNQLTVPLPLVVAGQPTASTSFTFGAVKMGEAPPGVVVSAISPDHPMNLDLGQAVRLRGFDLAQKDKSLLLRLYWESLVPLDADQTVFVHIKNRMGDTVAQMDRPPISGIYPTSLWETGEIIPDEVLIPLPENLPPNEYAIEVGMYNLATGARLPITGSPDNSATLLKIALR